MKMKSLASLALGAFATLAAVPCLAEEKLSARETKQIAEEAFIYGFPMVMNYAVFYEYFVDKSAVEIPMRARFAKIGVEAGRLPSTSSRRSRRRSSRRA